MRILSGRDVLAALFSEQPIDETARLERSVVVTDIDERRIGLDVQHPLLRGEHGNVFPDHLLALAVKLGGTFGIVGAEIVRNRPEIIRDAVGLRRDAMTDDEFPGLLSAFTLG